VLITPVPGADRDNLQKGLQEVRFGAVNARGAGGDNIHRYNAYVRWASEAGRMLRSQVVSADLERLVYTRRFWTLQAHPTPATEAVGRLVDAELDERVAELEAAWKAVDQQIKRWSRHGVFVVADSSFYIKHPQKLEELDLRRLLRLREEPVHLLFPILVVDELDRLKEQSKDHTRWRARYTLAVLDRILRNPTSIATLRESDYSGLDHGEIPRGEITVEIVFDPPEHTRLPIADDEIIDRAVAIQALAGRQVRMITYDTGQSTQARAAGLEVAKIAEPPEGDEPPRNPPRTTKARGGT
jgi:hypothetical protein